MTKLAALLVITGCTLDQKFVTTESAESTLGCPAGSYDMLDWMTLDSDLRTTTHLVSAAHPLYTVVEPNRFWWLKTDQGDTWDVVNFDANGIYFATTELGFHSPWAGKPPARPRWSRRPGRP